MQVICLIQLEFLCLAEVFGGWPNFSDIDNRKSKIYKVNLVAKFPEGLRSILLNDPERYVLKVWQSWNMLSIQNNCSDQMSLKKNE